MIKARR